MSTELAPKFHIRRVSPADAEAFARMMNDPAVFPGTLQVPYASVEMWRERLTPPGGHSPMDTSLVAEVNGEVVGSAGLFGVERAARRRHVMSLGISVVGAGQALMSALCTQADDWLGVLRIELTVFADNTHAVRLYERQGFVIEGRHRAYALRAGEWADTFSMARLHPRPPMLPS